METEKRIGNFRVNRKVAWVMCFPQPLHSLFSIQKALLRRLYASFLHSVGVEFRTPPPEPPGAFRQALHGRRIFVPQPPVGSGPRPLAALLLVQPPVAFDDDLLDLAKQPAVDQKFKVLAVHPGQQALEPRSPVYAPASGGMGAGASGMS